MVKKIRKLTDGAKQRRREAAKKAAKNKAKGVAKGRARSGSNRAKRAVDENDVTS